MILLLATAAFWVVNTLFAAATPAQVPLVETIATTNPTVRLDEATFTGKIQGNTAHYLGIPYASPPTGNLRFRLPEPVAGYKGNQMAQDYGHSCPQQAMTFPEWIDFPLKKIINKLLNEIYQSSMSPDEDCLTINVSMPKGAKPGDDLPVAVWIHGGGFEIGGTSANDGGVIVDRSIELGMPVVFVSMNYRLTAFGFMPGEEIRKAGVGNLGLQDQRLALRWVKKYIKSFGGDPSKVTIWGESAGAISASLHLLTNGGDNEGLFRGAIMQSGGPIPVGNITHGQRYYVAITQAAGCDESSDTLDCLRKLPYSTLKQAVDQSPNFFSYQSLVLAWLPRVDGVFLTAPPLESVLNNQVSNVPMITGNCDDEGSFFSISAANITTTSELRTYFKTYMLPNGTDAELDKMQEYYPDDPRAGCPFDTGEDNPIGGQFKRIAAIQGDVVFHGPRRFFVQQRGDKQPIWSFINKRLKGTPFIGSAHGTDLIQSFGDFELKDYIIHFVVNLDPNGKDGRGNVTWPRYDNQKRQSMMFQDSALNRLLVVKDDYRDAQLDFVAELSLDHPI
ncbi:alpha beta-hydrolase [Peniophora sp. CONT]|nr:alpha beta-hydrolase [Peniophora sp. CONT]